MRLLHTSDWHLGHTLKEVTREHEHAAFLAWLLETCAREAPDVLLITGDVFDSATPPASAERMWFEFLAAARRARPAMDIVAIAGNHDSPARLGAASAVLRELGVHVDRRAAAARRTARSISIAILIPVAGGQRPRRGGAVPAAGRCAGPTSRIRSRLVYGEVIAAARARRRAGSGAGRDRPLYVTGADPSYLSERRVSIGGQESASLRLFPDDIDYVALGHMHRAQRVGRDTIRYAGAPIALSLDEAGYRHQVVVDRLRRRARPRDARRSMCRRRSTSSAFRRAAAASLDEVLAALAALPLAPRR